MISIPYQINNCKKENKHLSVRRLYLDFSYRESYGVTDIYLSILGLSQSGMEYLSSSFLFPSHPLSWSRAPLFHPSIFRGGTANGNHLLYQAKISTITPSPYQTPDRYLYSTSSSVHSSPHAHGRGISESQKHQTPPLKTTTTRSFDRRFRGTCIQAKSTPYASILTPLCVGILLFFSLFKDRVWNNYRIPKRKR